MQRSSRSSANTARGRQAVECAMKRRQYSDGPRYIIHRHFLIPCITRWNQITHYGRRIKPIRSKWIRRIPFPLQIGRPRRTSTICATLYAEFLLFFLLISWLGLAVIDQTHTIAVDIANGGSRGFYKLSIERRKCFSCKHERIHTE